MGMLGIAKRVGYYAFALDSVSSLVRRTGRAGRDAKKVATSALRDAVIGDQSAADIGRASAEIENAEAKFDFIMGAAGFKEDDIPLLVKKSCGMALVSMLLLAANVGVFLAYYEVRKLDPNSFFISSLVHGALSVALLIGVFENSYRNWMLRRRSADGVLRFLSAKDLLPRFA